MDFISYLLSDKLFGKAFDSRFWQNLINLRELAFKKLNCLALASKIHFPEVLPRNFAKRRCEDLEA